MITVKVGEPKTKTIGDIWFDPTQRLTCRAVGLQTSITWTPIAPAILIGFPINPNKDDVYIEPVNNIPNVFDGTNWIPVVPPGYIFPPIVPKTGDYWTESLSQTIYMFFNGQWTPTLMGTISVANVSSQRPPPQIITSKPSFNLTPGAAAVPGNIIVTNAAPQITWTIPTVVTSNGYYITTTNGVGPVSIASPPRSQADLQKEKEEAFDRAMGVVG